MSSRGKSSRTIGHQTWSSDCADEHQAIMALDIEAAPAATLRPTPEVRRVVDPQDAPEQIRWEMEHTPDQVVYVAEVDGTSFSQGWAYFQPPSALPVCGEAK